MRDYQKPTHVIEPTKGLGLLDISRVWAYRDLLWILAARDVKVRYKQTALGCSWAVLQPLLSMIVFSVIFGRLAKIPSDGLPYPLFVLTGLLPWTFFSAAVGSSGNSMIGSASIITKVYFPRIIVPLSSVGGALVDFGVAFAVLGGLMAFYRTPVAAGIVVIPLLLLLLVLLSLGIGLCFAALNVTYRDFRYVIPFFLQLWMYVTPVVYPPSLFPEKWRVLIFLNPAAGIIDGFRSALLGKPWDALALGLGAAGSVIVFVAGVHFFQRCEKNFVDSI